MLLVLNYSLKVQKKNYSLKYFIIQIHLSKKILTLLVPLKKLWACVLSIIKNNNNGHMLYFVIIYCNVYLVYFSNNSKSG